MLNFKEILTVSLILFSVIDILGSVPVIIDLKKRTGTLHATQATFVAGLIMIAFLFLGESILKILGLDTPSFAIAGALVIFFLGLEMVLGIHFFRGEMQGNGSSASIVPIAFPIIAGAGTMTTILSLRAEYQQISILIAIILNLILVYAVLRASGWIERKLGQAGTDVLRKVFGVILLAIAIKMFRVHLGIMQ
ncbi:MAG: MarC family protein [Raineya sp.]|nr:MarC family protein [Raineya sp.]MDW8295450.1 MarC family protein [Raineya sp.]